MPQPPTAQAALDRLGLEAVCDRIIEGQSVNAICRAIEISASAFWRWVAADAERSARVKSARIASAATFAEQAGEVLEDKSIPIDRGREIASHKRWEAKMRNPRDFGEKLELSGELALHNLSAEELDARAATLAKQIAEAQAVAQSATGNA